VVLSTGYTITDLGTLGGRISWPTGLNDRGQVVGWSYTADNEFARVSRQPWQNDQHGHMTDLGTLGGSSAEATAINNHGDVVGWSDTTGDVAQHAFLDRNGTIYSIMLLQLLSPEGLTRFRRG